MVEIQTSITADHYFFSTLACAGFILYGQYAYFLQSLIDFGRMLTLEKMNDHMSDLMLGDLQVSGVVISK